jgi:hypothetical protein|tara:strand:+ start:1185 stop:1646 length:462 start_codon:yes stop_codon:yes gene_type:complete
MSTTKISKESSSKKTTPDANKGKVESVAKTTDTSTVDKAGSSTADKTANKAEAAPKSASQASLSHFSSVSTPEYRAGWQRIFGGGEVNQKEEQEVSNENEFPLQIEVQDIEINAELRSMLYSSLLAQANKQGVDIEKVKNSTSIEYSVQCKIR